MTAPALTPARRAALDSLARIEAILRRDQFAIEALSPATHEDALAQLSAAQMIAAEVVAEFCDDEDDLRSLFGDIRASLLGAPTDDTPGD